MDDVTSTRGRALRVGFVLLSPVAEPVPSTRISVLNMLPLLERAGIDAQIAYEPHRASEMPDVSALSAQALASRFDVVYFQKVRGPSVLKLVRDLNARNVATVYGTCDRVDVDMAQEARATIVVTEFLKSLYPAELHDRIEVVHDGIERPELRRVFGSAPERAAPVRVVLVTSQELTAVPALETLPSWVRLTIVGRYAWLGQPMSAAREIRRNFAARPSLEAKSRYATFLLNRRIRLRQWTPEGVYDELSAADIAILPIDRDDPSPAADWKVKSENRLTLKMAFGLPVIATPIPAYEPIVVQGENGFLAESAADWRTAFETLRSREVRRRIGEHARKSVLERFSKERQAKLLIRALHRVAERVPGEVEPRMM